MFRALIKYFSPLLLLLLLFSNYLWFSLSFNNITKRASSKANEKRVETTVEAFCS